jgi:hypothetical protein
MYMLDLVIVEGTKQHLDPLDQWTMNRTSKFFAA